MMRKQFLSTVLVVTMLGSMLVGCGQAQTGGSESSAVSSTVVSSEQESTMAGIEASDETTEDSTRISEETITLTVAGQYSGGTKDWNSTLQFAEYEKRMGLKFDATVYDAEQWSSKLTLMLASDSMPDIISYAKMTAMDVEKYGQEGYFLDFSQYLDIMPNLSRILEEYPDYAAAIKNEDGAIYAFSVLNAQTDSTFMSPIYFNKEWCDNLGLEVPETVEELYDVLVAFRDGDANGNGDPDDEIPLGIASNRHNAEQPILWGFGIYSRRTALHLQVDENGQVILGDITENYKAFLKYMKKLYDEGLINEDAYVITDAEMETKMNEDLIGQWCTWARLPGDRAKKWIGLGGYASEEYNSDRVTVLSTQVGSSYMLAANADTEYPEEIARFVDYLFTDEGYLSSKDGYEGVTFDFNVVNGASVVDHTKYAEGYEGDYRANVAIAPNAFEIYQSPAGTIYDMMDKTDTEGLLEGQCFELAGQNALKEAALRNENMKTVRVYPTLKYTTEELEERSILFTDINNYLTSVKVQFIIGETDIDTTWESYIAKLNEMGLERLLEIEQAAYDRYISK